MERIETLEAINAQIDVSRLNRFPGIFTGVHRVLVENRRDAVYCPAGEFLTVPTNRHRVEEREGHFRFVCLVAQLRRNPQRTVRFYQWPSFFFSFLRSSRFAEERIA